MYVIENLSIAHSFSVFGIEVEIDTTEPNSESADTLETMTVKALRDIARGRVKGFSKLPKTVLITAIRGLDEPRYTAVQVATAQAKLNMLPAKPRQGGRKAQPTNAA